MKLIVQTLKLNIMKNFLTESVRFKNYRKVEPENLISFSSEYEEYRQCTLIPNLKSMKGKVVSIIVTRIGHDEDVRREKLTCTIGELTSHGFFVKIGEDNEVIEKFINFYNVLGEVPMLVEDNINPYQVDSSEIFTGYFSKLNLMRNLLKTCEKTKKSVKLFFRYDKDHEMFRNGDYVIECNIIKVNKSNVEVKKILTRSFVSKENLYSEVGSDKTKIVSFVSSDCYLHKVTVSDCENKINPVDEDDC